MRRKRRSRRGSAGKATVSAWLLSTALMLGGCVSSHRIVSQWTDPGFASAPSRIVVIAAIDDTSVRRNFEDKFVARLRARGIDAVPSYRVLFQNVTADKPRLDEAVRRSNADAALVTRLVQVERRTQVDPGYYEPPPPAFGFYRWYSSPWHGYYRPPRVYRYEIYVSETTLYEAERNHVVWTATIRTTAPGDMSAAMDEYIDLVMRALTEKRLLAVSSDRASGSLARLNVSNGAPFDTAAPEAPLTQGDQFPK